MKFFMDTANIERIREYAELGIVDGVTTNPSLVAKEGKNFEEVIKEISSIVKGPISAEVLSLNTEGMIEEAKKLANIAPNIAIKIPMTKEGIKATYILSQKGINVNITLVFSPSQALLAAKVGAKFVSPFIGRLDDISHIGMDIVSSIRTIFDNYDFQTEIIVASIRHPRHIVEAAELGADIATVPPAVLEKIFHHPLTDIGIERFLDDWRKAFEK
ncbi:MAG: fructose-6-phosphate aldolase [Desulfurellaceae bacterium]|jgi:transaldolase|nr:fructose-6-phosphate aldolase [Desulfurellaceae bacterium]